MPVVKLQATSTPDAMKPEQGNDSLDTFIRQAIGKEPVLSFSRTGDSPVQWIQLLHALDQPDVAGWPFVSPLKVQMQKCEKCSREFCSQINYRRHIRVHRRSLNVDKDSHKYRDILAAFWDQLSLEEAKEVVSFKDVTLEEVTGSSIMRALTSFIRKPGYHAFPQLYLKAGSILLDIIQARPSRLPISSQELFCILDDASERTFLCAGTAESMQKYVFDGEAEKVGLDVKNIVACTSFLFEQKLIKAWLALKDAEALRCQKLLVEEEEAVQKRQAELVERKRRKKLRQKEQKCKEQAYEEQTDLRDITDDSDSPTAETSRFPVVAESIANGLVTPMDHAPSLLETVQSWITDGVADTEAQNGLSNEPDSSPYPNVERRTAYPSGRHHLVNARWQVPRSQRGGRNGFHVSQHPQVLKLKPVQKHGALRDPRAAPVVSGNKVWTRKPKSENDGESLKSVFHKEAAHQTNPNCELMIGSISVTLGNSTSHQQSDILGEAREHCSTEHALLKNSEKPTQIDSVEALQGGSNRSTFELWLPVSRHDTRGTMAVQSGSRESREVVMIGKDNDPAVTSETCDLDANGVVSVNNAHPLVEGRVPPKGLPFSGYAAKAFLAQRWKDAIAADHVKLVLTNPDSEPPGCLDSEINSGAENLASDSRWRSVLGNAENRLDESTTGTVKNQFRSKSEKGAKIKYIPKRKAVA